MVNPKTATAPVRSSTKKSSKRRKAAGRPNGPAIAPETAMLPTNSIEAHPMSDTQSIIESDAESDSVDAVVEDDTNQAGLAVDETFSGLVIVDEEISVAAESVHTDNTLQNLSQLDINQEGGQEDSFNSENVSAHIVTEDLDPIIGSFDECGPAGITGWVALRDSADPIQVELMDNSKTVDIVLANSYRPDLQDANLSDPNHGFSFTIPESFFDGSMHYIEIREVSSGLLLPGSPKVFRAVTRPIPDESLAVVGGENSFSDAEVNASPDTDPDSDGNVSDENVAANLEGVSIVFDMLSGYTGFGWAVPVEDGQGFIKLVFGEKTLGKIAVVDSRPDVQAVINSPTDRLGYKVMLGGVLQFSAMAKDLSTAHLRQFGPLGADYSLDLSDYYPEAYTFAPLKSFTRQLASPSIGKLCGATCTAEPDFQILIETGKSLVNNDNRVFVSFYQEASAGRLQAVGQFDVALSGQLSKLDFSLAAYELPVLMVVTDSAHQILLTDCIPFPALFMDKYAPLVEYHSLLSNGQATFDVVSKISRSHLDFHIDSKIGGVIDENIPRRENSEVLLFARRDFDASLPHDFQAYRHLAERVSYIDRDGSIKSSIDGVVTSNTMGEYLQESKAEFILFCEVTNTIRPDFWATINAHKSYISTQHDLIYWDSIWIEGSSRPYWVKNEILFDDSFSDERLAPINSVVIKREFLKSITADLPNKFRSGNLRLEDAFSALSLDQSVRVPVVMDTYRLALVPHVIERMKNGHFIMPELDRLTDVDLFKTMSSDLAVNSANQNGKNGTGVSIVINYRNAITSTLLCLQSISVQEFDGAIEIILVNNGSLPKNVELIVAAAVKLFGESYVKAIDYDGRFNHSSQCNRAVEIASNDYIFMLSNDSVLISPDAIARSIKVTSVPWVGTCGFRMVAVDGQEQVLKSFGLTLSSSKYLFAGAGPLTTNRPPTFVLDYTVGVSGNTFAALMVRKAVYQELGGLDEFAFPTDYNDVDFSLRTTSKGYRHIVIGGALISHTGRGSREMNLDLPTNPLIISRLPPVYALIDSFAVKPL